MDRQAAPEDTFAAYQDNLHRGHKALSQDDARGALKAYTAAAELADERALPHVLVGRALLRLNRAVDALAAFDRALARAAGDPSALVGKAEALLRLGRRDAAADVRRELEQAAKGAQPARDEQLISGPLPRAEVLAVAAERAWLGGRVDTAVEEWLRAARAYAEEGHIDAALDACQRALIIDSGSSRVHLELSRLYFVAGLVEHAVERLMLLGRLVELEPAGELRAQIAALCREHGEADPRLVQLAHRLDEPAPA